jgi:hypothetical protein
MNVANFASKCGRSALRWPDEEKTYEEIPFGVGFPGHDLCVGLVGARHSPLSQDPLHVVSGARDVA